MSAGRYAALRGEFKRRGILQSEVAEKIGRRACYVSQRFTGKAPWTQDEQYLIMDWLHLPYDQLHYYFPKDGLSVEKQIQPCSGQEEELLHALRVLIGGAGR